MFGKVFGQWLFVLKVKFKLLLMQEQLQGFVAILKIHPDDLDALEV